jgi:hypothetical protein
MYSRQGYITALDVQTEFAAAAEEAAKAIEQGATP